ncbi:hypothetical protein FOA52_012018 [Chlamydomonas sp. UWO 241]|nr:hypothetical protein FOA52_012018 [Chlamydomonas sp. UWO 241]
MNSRGAQSQEAVAHAQPRESGSPVGPPVAGVVVVLEERVADLETAVSFASAGLEDLAAPPPAAAAQQQAPQQQQVQARHGATPPPPQAQVQQQQQRQQGMAPDQEQKQRQQQGQQQGQQQQQQGQVEPPHQLQTHPPEQHPRHQDPALLMRLLRHRSRSRTAHSPPDPEQGGRTVNSAAGGHGGDPDPDAGGGSYHAAHDKRGLVHVRAEAADERPPPLLQLQGAAFAASAKFWVCIVLAVAQGFVLGFLGLAFINSIETLSEATWLSTYYKEYRLGSLRNEASTRPLVTGGQLGTGEWWWVGMLAGGGAAVGLFKVLWSLLVSRFPDRTPGFVAELRDLQAHDVLLPIGMLCASTLSIGLGASVGPEAGMGAVGVACGTAFAADWGWLMGGRAGGVGASSRLDSDAPHCRASISGRHGDDANAPARSATAGRPPHRRPSSSSSSSRLDSDGAAHCRTSTTGSTLSTLWSALRKALNCSSLEDIQSLSFDGMCGAFGPLLPAQWIAPLMLVELGGVWHPHIVTGMGHVTRAGICASVSYTIFMALENLTFLTPFEMPVATYDSSRLIEPAGLAQAVPLGFFSGLLGLLFGSMLGLFGALGSKVQGAIDQFALRCRLPGSSRGYVGQLVTPTIGGALAGLLAVACPLTLGDGSKQIGEVALNGSSIGAASLAAHLIIKMVACGISLGFGFVGGQIFPLVFAGTCLGSLVHEWVPSIDIIVALPCCIAALPGALFPAPFALTALMSTLAATGGPASAPVFIAVLVSHATVCGSGLMQRLVKASFERQNAAAAMAAAAAAAGAAAGASALPSSGALVRASPGSLTWRATALAASALTFEESVNSRYSQWQL